MGRAHIGEFEQMVLLSILQLGDEAYAVEVRKELEARAGRTTSRSALYRTFDRLESKGYLEWETEPSGPVPERGGHPMRSFRVTEAGVETLKVSRAALVRLWEGLDGVLGRP